MKKFICSALAAAAVCGTAYAEGYQINSLSAKQIGMGHTGVALKLGAESMFFNPAGLGFMDKTLDLSGSLTGIMPTATATVDGKDYKTDNGISTPIGVHSRFTTISRPVSRSIPPTARLSTGPTTGPAPCSTRT